MDDLSCADEKLGSLSIIMVLAKGKGWMNSNILFAMSDLLAISFTSENLK